MAFRRPKLEDFPYFPDGYTKKSDLDIKYLIPGCQKLDCIPSIDNPKWLANDLIDTDWQLGEEVLAIFIIRDNDVMEVYGIPVTILDYHEICNFYTTDNQPVAITYCPLCQTATAYERFIEDNEIELGVSGLLYNSALVLYDRKTNSLFSQVLSKGIIGKYTGKSLLQLPIIQTDIDNLLKLYPSTFILSKDTGFPKRQKYYGSYPYYDYKKSEKINFPINRTNDKYHPKELVFVIELNKKSYIILQKNLKGFTQFSDFYTIQFCGGFVFFKGKYEEKLNWKNWIPSGISFYFTAIAYFPNSEILN